MQQVRRKAGNGQNRSIVHCNPCLNIWASRTTTHQPAQTDILRPKLSRSTIIKDFTVVHFHQTKKTSVYFQSSNSVSWTVTISYWITSRLRNYQWNQFMSGSLVVFIREIFLILRFNRETILKQAYQNNNWSTL